MAREYCVGVGALEAPTLSALVEVVVDEAAQQRMADGGRTTLRVKVTELLLEGRQSLGAQRVEPLAIGIAQKERLQSRGS